MNKPKFNPEDMPILDIDTSGLEVFDIVRYLDSPEAIGAFLAEVIKVDDPQLLMRALGDVVKALGVYNTGKSGTDPES